MTMTAGAGRRTIPSFTTPEEHGAFTASETVAWRKVIRASIKMGQTVKENGPPL